MFIRKIAGITAAGAMVLGSMAGLASTAHAAADPIKFSCDGAFGPMEYETAGNPTVTRDGQSVKVDWAVDDLPGIVPIPVAEAAIEVTSNLLVNDTAVEGSGEHKVAIGVREPIALPNVVASVKTAATAINVKVVDFEIAVTNFDMTFPCTLDAPVDLGDFTTDPDPTAPKPPVVKAKNTKTNSKVKFNQKAKKATVTVTVKAGKQNAKGKVRIIVKKGKKVIVKKAVKLNKNGKAKLVVKKGKLKQKGVYKVNANYLGNKNFKKSKSKVKKFRVKK